MKAIYEFQTIQVELTNACVHECSNCTRFCGHHKKPFFMDWETYKKSIDSLENWPRLIGIMGGEPTLHPDFDRYVEYASEKHPKRYNIGGGQKPFKSLSKYIFDANALVGQTVNKFHGLGLWSSVCNSYSKHYETIQDNFIFQCINDHTESSRHQAWLMTRKEFGIGDEEWIKMRDNCWWQKFLGSPSITPKGAFFCEVAAAMDMLFNGPGGWPIEKDWWKRGPEDFKDQLHWCELCSGAFTSFDRDANESIDDVSPFMYEKLKSINSPKLNKEGAICVHSVGKNSDVEIRPREYMMLYQTDPELRFTDKNKALYPKHICAIVLYDENDVQKKNTDILKQMFDNVIFVGKGGEVGKRVISSTIKEEWILIFYDIPENIDMDFRNKINRTIFNPGTIHNFIYMNALMYNVNAKSAIEAGYTGFMKCNTLEDIIDLWPENKRCELNNGFEEYINEDVVEWRENVLKGGIMYWDGVKGELDNLIVRRKLEPQIKKITNSNMSFVDKMSALEKIDYFDIESSVVCNKIKTAIQNELAIELHQNNMNFDTVKDYMAKSNYGYCGAYALAMLSCNSELEYYLKKCVLNNENKIGLGIIMLRNYYIENEHSSKSLMEELYSLGSGDGGIILLGNRYVGKSIAMIYNRMSIKIRGFSDDERRGYIFENVETWRADEILSNNCEELLLCVDGVLENRMVDDVYKYCGQNKEINRLSETYYKELHMYPMFSVLGIDVSLFWDGKHDLRKLLNI